MAVFSSWGGKMTFWSADSKTGKAGERFVATLIEDTIHYMFDPRSTTDIGIDGEIEIAVPSKKGSKRGFKPCGLSLKVQIKTKAKLNREKRFSVPVSLNHLQYYATLSVPIILIVVCLHSKRAWWKPIEGVEAYRTGKGAFSVRFDIEDDVLDEGSAVALKFLADQTNAMSAEYLIQCANEDLDGIDEEEKAGEIVEENLYAWAPTLIGAEKLADAAEVLLRFERRSSPQIDETRWSLKGLRSRVATAKRTFVDAGFQEMLLDFYPDRLSDI